MLSFSLQRAHNNKGSSMFQSVQKQVLSDQIFEQIRDQILLGQLKTGDFLPSERKLCDLFKVNRGAIREALKKLQQLGLIHIQQGGKTHVLDFNQSASINLLPDLLFVQNQINPSVVYAVLELRIALGKDVIRLCVDRITNVQIKQLHLIVQQMHETDDESEREKASMQFWQILVAGSGNIAYQLAFNTLAQTFTLMRTTLHDLLSKEWNSIEYFRQLTIDLDNKQSEHAQKTVDALLTSPGQAQFFFQSQT